MPPLAIVAAASIGGSIASSVIGSRAAGKAADTQARATEYAADLARKSEQEALQLQRESLYNQRSDMMPWLQTGTGAMYTLGNLMGVPTPEQQQILPSLTMPYEGSQQQQIEQQRRLGQIGEELKSPENLMSTAFDAMGQVTGWPIQGPYNYRTDALRNERGQLQGELSGAIPLTGFMPNSSNQSGISYDPNTGMIKSGMGQQVTPTKATSTPTQSPYNMGQTGELALPMSEVMKDWQTEPGYQFRQQEGEDALMRYLAGNKGMPFGGTAAKGLMEFNQNLASGEYQNVWNRTAADRTDRFNKLAALAGIGQTAAQSTGNAAMQGAANQGNIMTNSAAIQGDLATQAANARASSAMYGANMWGNTINNMAQLPGQLYMLNELFK